MGNFAQQYRMPIVIIAFLLIGLVAFWNWHIAQPAPVNVTAVPLGTINMPIRIDRTGFIVNSTSIPVNTEYSGDVSEIYVKEGQLVKAGQPLLKLQGSSASSIESEPSAVNRKTGVSQQAQDNYDNALKDFNRYQNLYQLGAIPRRQLDSAAARLQQAQEDLSNDQNAISSTNTAARTLNGSATITAPIDGIVTGLSTAPGKTVQAGQQLMTLGSGKEIEAAVHLKQSDLYLVHLGTPAIIEVSNQTMTGQVSSIYPEIEGNQISSFLAHIKLTNNPEGLLTPGMSVNVRINTDKSTTVLAVPTVSVFHDEQGQNFVYEAANGTAVCQQVSIGETSGDFTEITSNLSQKTMIITSNINKIKNGNAISVIQ